MPKPRSGTTPQRDKTRRRPGPERGRSALRRKAETAGDALASLASAGETPAGSDRILAQAFSRIERLGAAQRRVSEKLALERRRNEALRREIRRLRGELPDGGRRIPSAG